MIYKIKKIKFLTTNIVLLFLVLNPIYVAKSEGKASSKAVEFAVLQVTLAIAGVASATIAATAATAGAASAASSSFGTGMYGAAYMNTIATGIKNTDTSLISHASTFSKKTQIFSQNCPFLSPFLQRQLTQGIDSAQ